ncbi:MAG TPA: hypothetical protein VFG91_02560 [Woeseiaceae bacterium]|nr:hypothetical protein [Woeseiaceae bacterium]
MHKPNASVLFSFCALLFLAGGARGETTVRVLETYPAGDVVTLGDNQSFYLRLAYSTDDPVRIWARPFFQGKDTDAGSSPSRVYTGSGETLGWFFFFEPGKQVDEVRISVGDGSRDGTHVAVSYPVRVTSSDRPEAGTEPAWLVKLRKEDRRLLDQQFEQRMNTPSSVGEDLFFSGFMMVVLGLGIVGLMAPVWAWRRWKGGWRVAAAVPGAMMGFVVLRIVFGTAADPTSHNLWPFEILQVGFLSLVVIGVLLGARKLSGARA